jgi:glycerophosphoryl diester phosphodiesterase
MAGKPLIIGHRGASSIAPENTLASFRQAIEAGADGVEFDVRLARDGVPVIIHDETLQRTASIQKRVADLSSVELQQVNVGSWFSHNRKTTEEFAAERIPTLQQLFDLLASTTALFYLEMKCAPFERIQLATECCRLVGECSLRRRVIVECFDLAGIEAVKKLDPNIRSAALFEPNLSNASSLVIARRLIDRAKSAGADEIAIHYKLASRRLIDKAQLNGLRVVVWTVDDPDWVQRSPAAGIDVLITNNPTIMLRARDPSLVS